MARLAMLLLLAGALPLGGQNAPEPHAHSIPPLPPHQMHGGRQTDHRAIDGRRLADSIRALVNERIARQLRTQLRHLDQAERERLIEKQVEETIEAQVESIVQVRVEALAGDHELDSDLKVVPLTDRDGGSTDVSWFRRQIDALAADPEGVQLRDEHLRMGPVLVVAHGDTAPGSVFSRGMLNVHGVVRGHAVAHGDVVVHHTGVVLGDALAVGGRVRVLDGGKVMGEIRAVGKAMRDTPAIASRAGLRETWGAVKLALAWTAMLVLIGVGVLIVAEERLAVVVETAGAQFGRSFLWGVAGQLGALPAMLAGSILLAITVVGLLAIPIFLVGFLLGAAGLVTLGFLTTAQITGAAISRARRAPPTSPRGEVLRALLTGILAYLGLWVLAALLTWTPVLGMVLRILALAATWAAVTLGLGAALLSRAGTRPLDVEPAQAPPVDDIAWQTPTPVTGVAAARRPTPYPEP